MTMAEHWSVGAQVVMYASDYVDFTGNSTRAINAQTQLDNQLGAISIEEFSFPIEETGFFFKNLRSFIQESSFPTQES